MNSHQKSLVNSNPAMFLNAENNEARDYADTLMKGKVKRKGDGVSVVLNGHTGQGDYSPADWGMERR